MYFSFSLFPHASISFSLPFELNIITINLYFFAQIHSISTIFQPTQKHIYIQKKAPPILIDSNFSFLYIHYVYTKSYNMKGIELQKCIWKCMYIIYTKQLNSEGYKNRVQLCEPKRMTGKLERVRMFLRAYP